MCQGVVRRLFNRFQSSQVRKVASLLAEPLSDGGEGAALQQRPWRVLTCLEGGRPLRQILGISYVLVDLLHGPIYLHALFYAHIDSLLLPPAGNQPG